MNFASNLQKLRKGANMSQEALAEKLDVTRQSVSKWESGATYPEMDKLIAICKIFKVDMDTLVNGDVNNKKESNEKEETNINPKEVLSKFDIFMKKVVTLFDNMSFKEIIGFIATIIVLIIIICFLRLPVELLENLIGDNFLYNLGVNIGPILNSIFYVIIDIIYGVFSLFLFVYALKIKYFDHIIITNNIKSKETDKEFREEEVSLEKKEVIISSKPKDHAFTNFLSRIIIYSIKFFLLWFLLAIIFCLVFLAVVFGFLVLFVIKGFPLVGVLLGTISALMICSVCFVIPFNFVVNHKNSYKKILITLVSAFTIFLIGCIFFAFEFFSVTFIDGVPSDFDQKTITTTYKMADNFDTLAIHNNVTYIVDNSLVEDVVVKITYYDSLYLGKIENKLTNNNKLIIYRNSPKEFNLKEILASVAKDLKEGKVYNYSNLDRFEVTITSSEENIKKIKANNRSYYE